MYWGLRSCVVFLSPCFSVSVSLTSLCLNLGIQNSPCPQFTCSEDKLCIQNIPLSACPSVCLLILIAQGLVCPLFFYNCSQPHQYSCLISALTPPPTLVSFHGLGPPAPTAWNISITPPSNTATVTKHRVTVAARLSAMVFHYHACIPKENLQNVKFLWSRCTTHQHLTHN